MIEVAVFDTKPYDREFLTAAGGKKVRWYFYEFRLSPQTAQAATGAKAVCVFVNDTVDADCINKLADLGVKLIALRCAGFNNVDLKTAKARKVPVVRVPAYSPHAVAEHAVALLLTLSRRTHRAYNRVRELNFSLNGLVGANVHGKTVGVVGTGKIGRITAQLFRGFDATVLAYDPMASPDWARQHGVRYVELPELLAASDIVSLHLPLLPETKHLINARTLAQMKRGAVLINTSRGKLIETKALIQALKSGHVGGVALDVYEEEEGIFFEDLSGQVLQDDLLSRLLTFPNVLITSHQAFLTKEALGEIAHVTVTNILEMGAGNHFIEGTQL
jgi:D-lactate dehydrogenase